MDCLVCGNGEMQRAMRELPYSYKSETMLIPNVSGQFCTSCEEVILDPEEAARVSTLMMDFNREVNSVAVDPEFIIGVRKKLALDQREAAELFGGGVNAFSRYENGKTRPPLALVKLLKILDRHPDLLAEVRAA